MRPDPLTLAMQHVDLPALPADPRPGTRALAQTALGALGIELVLAEPAAAVARVVLDRHGGRAVLLVAAETVASTAANLHVGGSRRAFGAELDAAWLGDPIGTVLVVATPLLTSGDLHVWRLLAADEAGTQLLEGRCTLGVVDAPGQDR